MFGGDAVETSKQNDGTYTFLMPAGAVTVTATFRDELGTSSKPFEIHNSTDWDNFAAKIASGTATSDYYKLADDFDNSIEVTTPVGTESEPFRGHFDGNGKTLFVNINDTSAQGTAPFRYISGATIENLTISGSVTGGTHASGLVGFNRSGVSTINNVTVNVNVENPNAEGNLHIGGVLGHNKSAQISMTNVVFGGTISNNGSFAGGLVGWSDSSTVNLSNCLFKGEYTGSGTFHPIACKNAENTVTAAVTHTYYTVSSGGTLGANNVTDNGMLVYALPIADKINLHIVAADGVTYYIPTTVRGLYSYYNNVPGTTFTPNFTVIGEDGTVLEAGTDYTVEYSPDTVAAEGVYTATLTGINGHSGTYTKAFTLLGAITYVDASGTAQTPITDYTVINEESNALSGGWYVAAGDVTANSRLTVSGNVNIILCDGATLNATKGVRVDNGNSLTIWAQGEGSGKLIATNENTHAAIGSLANIACGTITINGGVIDAHGGNNGAAIGGGNKSYAGTITINGGKVNASASGVGAGIGMGQDPSQNSVTSSVTINGGIVVATSTSGSGIGHGQYPNKKTITVLIGNEDPASFVSVTANKVSGTVTLTSELTDKTTVFHTGAVSDPSVLNGKTLMSCVRTESTYNNTESGKQLFINSYHVPADAVLLIGWYDEDGVMLSSDIMTKNNTTVTVFGSELADHATVFVWEDLDSIRPLCECEIIPFENE